jgi:hypothetical protein
VRCKGLSVVKEIGYAEVGVEGGFIWLAIVRIGRRLIIAGQLNREREQLIIDTHTSPSSNLYSPPSRLMHTGFGNQRLQLLRI